MYLIVNVLVLTYCQAKIRPPDKLCDVLFKSHTSCHIFSFTEEDLICFTSGASLLNSSGSEVQEYVKNKTISACRKWSTVSFTTFRDKICLEVQSKNWQLQSKNGSAPKEEYVTSGAEKENPSPADSCVKHMKLIHNSYEETFLNACIRGKLDVVKCLIKAGLADINCRGNKGRTPVMMAVRRGKFKVFEYLITKGCNLSLVDNNRDNVLHVAIFGSSIDIVRKLVVDMRYNMETRGWQGWTPVMMTSYIGQLKMFELLMNEGCNLT